MSTRITFLISWVYTIAHIDALQLEVGVTVVGARRVDAVLVRDDLPELGADLVACVARPPSVV